MRWIPAVCEGVYGEGKEDELDKESGSVDMGEGGGVLIPVAHSSCYQNSIFGTFIAAATKKIRKRN